MGIGIDKKPPSWSAECYEPDQLLDLLEDRVEPGQKSRMQAHINSCPICSKDFTDTQEVWSVAKSRGQTQQAGNVPSVDAPITADASPARPPRSSPRQSSRSGKERAKQLIGATALALLACLSGFLLNDTRQQTQTARLRRDLNKTAASLSEKQGEVRRLQTANAGVQEKLATLKTQHQQFQQRRNLEKDTFSQQLAQVKKEYAQQLRSKEFSLLAARKEAQHISAHPDASASSQLLTFGRYLSESAVMGTTEPISSPVKLYAPVRVIIPNRRVDFAWKAVPGATTYTVWIRNPNGGDVRHSDPVLDTAWVTNLPPNTKALPYYIWWIATDSKIESARSRFIVLPEAH